MNLTEKISRIRNLPDDDLINEILAMIRDGVGHNNMDYFHLERELKSRLQVSTAEYPYGCAGDDVDDYEIDCPGDQLYAAYKIFSNIHQRLKLMRSILPLTREDAVRINGVIGHPYLCPGCGVVMNVVSYKGIGYSQCPECQDKWVIPGLSQGDEKAYHRMVD